MPFILLDKIRFFRKFFRQLFYDYNVYLEGRLSLTTGDFRTLSHLNPLRTNPVKFFFKCEKATLIFNFRKGGFNLQRI